MVVSSTRVMGLPLSLLIQIERQIPPSTLNEKPVNEHFDILKHIVQCLVVDLLISVHPEEYYYYFHKGYKGKHLMDDSTEHG